MSQKKRNAPKNVRNIKITPPVKVKFEEIPKNVLRDLTMRVLRSGRTIATPKPIRSIKIEVKSEPKEVARTTNVCRIKKEKQVVKQELKTPDCKVQLTRLTQKELAACEQEDDMPPLIEMETNLLKRIILMDLESSQNFLLQLRDDANSAHFEIIGMSAVIPPWWNVGSRKAILESSSTVAAPVAPKTSLLNPSVRLNRCDMLLPKTPPKRQTVVFNDDKKMVKKTARMSTGGISAANRMRRNKENRRSVLDTPKSKQKPFYGFEEEKEMPARANQTRLLRADDGPSVSPVDFNFTPEKGPLLTVQDVFVDSATITPFKEESIYVPNMVTKSDYFPRFPGTDVPIYDPAYIDDEDMAALLRM